MENTRHNQGLKKTIFSIILVVSFTPLVLMMGITGYEFHTTYRSKVLAYLEELMEKHAQNIDHFLVERLMDVRALAGTSSFEELAEPDHLAKSLYLLQELSSGVLVDLGLVMGDGRQVAYAGPFRLGKADYSDALWFKETMKKQNYISDVFLGLRGMPHFIVAVKMKEEPGEWILRGTIDFLAFNRLVENIRMGRTGQAFIINKKGAFQTEPRMSPGGGFENITESIWESASSPEQESALITLAMYAAGQSQESHPANSFTINDTPTGKDRIIVAARLKNKDWALVYQQDAEEAFASLYKARNISILVLLIGGLAISLTASILSKRVFERVEKGEKDKQRMNEKVIEAGKLASLGELAAGIAHEINNPVAIMVEEGGWIGDLLEEDSYINPENIDEIKRSLDQIHNQGRRCKQITHKLLSFARKTDPIEKEIDLNELIGEVVVLSGQHAKFNNVKMDLALGSQLPKVNVSPSEMQQVLVNFINNAIDAIDPGKGGKVTISTRMENEHLVVDIADTGSGIPKAIQNKIFDPFFTTKSVGKGTGLGLSICYGIIKKMGGKITLQSSPGMGTIFHVHLPITRTGNDEGNGNQKIQEETL